MITLQKELRLETKCTGKFQFYTPGSDLAVKILRFFPAEIAKIGRTAKKQADR